LSHNEVATASNLSTKDLDGKIFYKSSSDVRVWLMSRQFTQRRSTLVSSVFTPNNRGNWMEIGISSWFSFV